ncbi:hypothetical protein FIM05_01860 [SAR202 cluster bacterium AD-802-K11_MRT_200m]|nr:hypothetical protein [SAR202 cluster bacterium AD-802-K11_MRT_200m]
MKWLLTLTVSVILLAGCATEEADTPAFSEGEAIAVAQTKLMEIGCDGWRTHLVLHYILDWAWEEDYLGDGKWKVNVSHRTRDNPYVLVASFEVYEQSLSIGWLYPDELTVESEDSFNRFCTGSSRDGLHPHR